MVSLSHEFGVDGGGFFPFAIVCIKKQILFKQMWDAKMARDLFIRKRMEKSSYLVCS